GKHTAIYKQCFSVTYSLVSDFTNEELPLEMKKKLSKAASQTKQIYKITQSSTHSFEQVDSIAHICGGKESVTAKPEVIIRAIGQESVDFFYHTKTVQKCFTVQEPEYLDG